MTAPSLIQPLGVVPLIPSPLPSAVPVILPQAPSGPSYAIYLQPAQAQTMTPPQGLSPTVCPTPSSNATRSKGSTDTTTENAANDPPKSSASARPGSLLPGLERQGTKNRDREPAGERGSKRASMLEDNGSKKKFINSWKKPMENCLQMVVRLYCLPVFSIPSGKRFLKIWYVRMQSSLQFLFTLVRLYLRAPHTQR